MITCRAKIVGGDEFEVPVKFWSFPAGERGVRVEMPSFSIDDVTSITIRCDFRGSDDLIDLILLNDAVNEYFQFVPVYLVIPYFPYARQDRRSCLGESHSLKVIAKLINGCDFNRVFVVDPHSIVLEGLIDRISIVDQCEAFMSGCIHHSMIRSFDVVIAPDNGAIKKASKIAAKIGAKLVVAEKVRNPSDGAIVGVSFSDRDLETLKDSHAIVVDDICDGGRTFIELAKAIDQDHKPERLSLFVTHGIFSKGIDVIFEAGYSGIFCYNDMRTFEEE